MYIELYDTIKHWNYIVSLGLDAVHINATIARMNPVVQQMVDKMCEEAKEDMKAIVEHTYGSWKQAVTSADAAWPPFQKWHIQCSQLL